MSHLIPAWARLFSAGSFVTSANSTLKYEAEARELRARYDLHDT
jgi:hypothetical protein